MSKKTAIAALIAMAGIAMPYGAQAAPFSPSPGAIESGSIEILTRVQSKSGGAMGGTSALRTFRPIQVSRIRPHFAPYSVRPGRPLAHRSTVRPPHLKRAPRRAIHGKRPHRPPPIHVAGSAPPVLPPAIYEDNTQDRFPLSPDFCQYWSDRGIITSHLEPCW